jgi:dTDP-4-amino-4,6-dideoxygalactose transaminase
MTTRSQNLAILGGPPAFTEKLHVGRPNIGDREQLLKRINHILDSKWLTNDGVQVQKLEKRIADFVGVKHCIAMCNATIAMEIAIRALGLAGEVIIPSMTFIATAHALQWQEITPVFCDIDPATHNIDPRRIEELITPRTTGIIAVHLWGRPCNMEALEDIARRHNLKLLYDAAHAFGCSHAGRMIGGFGHAEVFSFHATKFFNTLEGGAVVTNDDDLAGKIRLMKNFGFSGYDCVVYIGTNGKMNEVSAAVGLTSFEAMDEFIATNRCNYQSYKENLKGIPGVLHLSYDTAERNNFQYIVVEIDEMAACLSRDELVETLWVENVIARRYFYPGCHRMEPYRSLHPHAGLLLPETERMVERTLLLPNGTAVNPDQIATICGILRAAIARGAEVRARLSERRASPTIGAEAV